jgi:hypothetical protein
MVRRPCPSEGSNNRKRLNETAAEGAFFGGRFDLPTPVYLPGTILATSATIF